MASRSSLCLPQCTEHGTWTPVSSTCTSLLAARLSEEGKRTAPACVLSPTPHSPPFLWHADYRGRGLVCGLEKVRVVAGREAGRVASDTETSRFVLEGLVCGDSELWAPPAGDSRIPAEVGGRVSGEGWTWFRAPAWWLQCGPGQGWFLCPGQGQQG